MRNLQDKYMNIEANDLSLFNGGTQDATSTHTHTHKLRNHIGCYWELAYRILCMCIDYT